VPPPAIQELRDLTRTRRQLTRERAFGESAGKHRSTRIRKGAPWLKPVLVQAAWGAARKKNSYFQAQFLRLKARHGGWRVQDARTWPRQEAAIAVAASILTTVYHMLRDGTCYQDLGLRRTQATTSALCTSRPAHLLCNVFIATSLIKARPA
jgi:hypothetical protein